MASVVFTEPAEYDLLDIEYYIYVDLCKSSSSSKNIGWHIRCRFYYYDMQNDVVYIIRVLYNKVDWQSIFK